MTAPTLVDLSPVWQLMLVGLLLAAAALTWLWLRQTKRSRAGWVKAVTYLTLFLTFDLVLFGAFTRLTDSGLGCPDWPGCYGSVSPIGARDSINVAQAAMPSGPVSHRKAWIEMVHRYMATGVGALIFGLAIASWRNQSSGRGRAPALEAWWPTLTFAWVCVQGAFGALTVTMKLFPAIVTLHLLGGLVLLVLLVVQAWRLGQAEAGARQPVSISDSTRGLLLLTCGLLALQVALGGWVSTNYAVLACSDFPTCNDSWWPEMRFDAGFQIWRELGMTAQGDPIPFAALTAIHYAHRLFAVIVLATLGVLAWRLSKVAQLRPLAHWLAGLSLTQFASGLGNIVLGWPLAAALLHTAGAAALVLVLTWLVVSSRSRGAPDAIAAARAAPRTQS